MKLEGGVRTCRTATGAAGAECSSDMVPCIADSLPHYMPGTRGSDPNQQVCSDTVTTRKCLRKAARGKCTKRRIRVRKCPRTCGTCI